MASAPGAGWGVQDPGGYSRPARVDGQYGYLTCNGRRTLSHSLPGSLVVAGGVTGSLCVWAVLVVSAGSAGSAGSASRCYVISSQAHVCPWVRARAHVPVPVGAHVIADFPTYPNIHPVLTLFSRVWGRLPRVFDVCRWNMYVRRCFMAVRRCKLHSPVSRRIFELSTEGRHPPERELTGKAPRVRTVPGRL